MSFKVNGRVYKRYNVLSDGIYPNWSYFLQPIHKRQGDKKTHYTKVQEGACKDVERAFGILQARQETIKNPTRHWKLLTITNIIIACIIFYNMIEEDGTSVGFELILEGGLDGGQMQEGT